MDSSGGGNDTVVIGSSGGDRNLSFLWAGVEEAGMFNTNCNSTFGGGCLVYERFVVSILSAVASAVLAAVLLRNAMRRSSCGRGGPRCEAAWPKLHHYALFFVSIADLLVALNYAVSANAFLLTFNNIKFWKEHGYPPLGYFISPYSIFVAAAAWGWSAAIPYFMAIEVFQVTPFATVRCRWHVAIWAVCVLAATANCVLLFTSVLDPLSSYQTLSIIWALISMAFYFANFWGFMILLRSVSASVRQSQTFTLQASQRVISIKRAIIWRAAAYMSVYIIIWLPGQVSRLNAAFRITNASDIPTNINTDRPLMLYAAMNLLNSAQGLLNSAVFFVFEFWIPRHQRGYPVGSSLEEDGRTPLHSDPLPMGPGSAGGNRANSADMMPRSFDSTFSTWSARTTSTNARV